MANTTRDGNFVPGGSIGIIQQLDLTTKWPQTVAILDGSGNQITSFNGGSVTQGTSPWVVSLASTTITGSVGVTGTFWQATQPISGAVTNTVLSVVGAGAAATAQRVQLSDESLAALENITVISSGTVTANAGTNLNTSLLALETGGNLATIVTNTNKIPALGQALAAGSVPVILPTATITSLTPPAAITGFALEAGHLATIDTNTGKIPSQGQALAAASMPVVLTAAQITTLTPLATVAVTGTFWQATQPVSGTFWQATQPVSGTVAFSNTTIAVTNTGTFAVQAAATLAAETTKVIGVVRNSDGAGNLWTSNSTTYTAKFAQDSNLLGTLGTAFTTAGFVDIKGADGNVFVRQATASNLNATVVGTGTFATQSTLAAETTKVIGTVNIAATQITTLTPPASLSVVGGGNNATALRVVISDDRGLPAGSNVIGHVIADTGSTTAVTGTVATAEVVPTTIFNGKTTVTTAGTRVTLAASTAVDSVTIKALAANTGTIYVGNATVAASNGFALAAGDTVSIDLANLNTINIDSSVNGEGVTYIAIQ